MTVNLDQLEQERDDLRRDRDLAWACIDALEMGLYGEDTPQGRSRDTLEERALALTRAVRADLALDAAEARGLDLDPAEHRELIAEHDAALAAFRNQL